MNLYRNKKIDLLTFKHLEQELLGLGQEISYYALKAIAEG